MMDESQIRLKYIRFHIDENLYLVIYLQDCLDFTKFNPQDIKREEKYLEEQISGYKDPKGIIFYDSAAKEKGLHDFSLYENKRYYWKLLGHNKYPNLNISSTFISRDKAEWNTYIGGFEGDFRVTNYLGTAFLNIKSPELVIPVDIISEKINYETEYRSMVESIAEQCQQLLLEWDSPTSFSITDDPNKIRRILLEQFLFVKHVLKPEKLEVYLETIARNPDSSLFIEESWKPIARGVDRNYFRQPLKYGRGWEKQPGMYVNSTEEYLPSENLAQKKYPTFNTPANRFIKYALQNFRDVCESVIDKFSEKSQQGAAYLEASLMLDALDTFLAQPFFKEVGTLQQVPLNNQVLQKKEGYRQILEAWILLETAARLDWPGREDAYSGTNRDASVLYEYWLYFVVFRILREKIGLEFIENTKKSKDDFPEFISFNEEGLSLSLKQGKISRSVFVWHRDSGGGLRVHFYYNRHFGQKNDVSSAGTYSRNFRPDYTMVVFPARYAEKEKNEAAEIEAEKQGKIAYLHFDAKYRVDKLSAIFGEKEADFDEEHRNMAIDTYKRGDLYKMHTYNEAIRRTVGSYVIYPGDGRNKELFQKYHEILPGVGAFAVKPVQQENGDYGISGEETLGEFIKDVLEHQQSKLTEQYRISYWTHKSVKEEPKVQYKKVEKEPELEMPAADTDVMLVYMEREDIERIQRNGKYSIQAIIDGKPININHEIFKAKYILGYFKIKEDLKQKYKSVDWLGDIQDVNLQENTQKNNYLYEVRFKIITSTIDPLEILIRNRRIPEVRKWINILGKQE